VAFQILQSPNGGKLMRLSNDFFFYHKEKKISSLIINWIYMEIITLESVAYKELEKKISLIADFVNSRAIQETPNDDDIWIDNFDVCDFLKISTRTLQRLRTAGEVTYSILGGKCYYKIGDLKRLLEDRVVRHNKELIDGFIAKHQEYHKRKIKRMQFRSKK
jgi:hypothetical protein